MTSGDKHPPMLNKPGAFLKAVRTFFLRIWYRIYWKIFLWFWLGTCVLVTAVILTLLYTVEPGDFLPERRALLEELQSKSLMVDRAGFYNSAPIDVLEKVSRAMPLSSYTYLVLVSGDGRLISLGRYPLRKVRKTVFEMAPGSTPEIRLTEGQVIVGPATVRLRSEDYSFFMVKKRPRYLFSRVESITRSHPGYVWTALLVSVLLCLILTLYLVRPLRNLQNAVGLIANGDLSARVGRVVCKRHDEFGELGRDFDVMAEQLERLDQHKLQLLRNVSHELRSPLTRLQLSLALARNKTIGQAELEHDRIEREIGRLDEMIGRIILWSKMLTATSTEQAESFRLHDTVKMLVEDADFEAGAKNRSVELIHCDECTVQGNKNWLSSAVENIIRNAIRFAPEESAINVSLVKAQEAITLTVRDYGPGVPNDAVNHLFEPFYRVDETRGGDNSGSGLGMAIARAAVEGHGGTISARNVVPGLEITIFLPVNS